MEVQDRASAKGIQFGALSLKEHDGVGVITFDTPDEKVNVLNSKLFSQFEAICRYIEESKSITSLVIISGKKDCFIAGADIEELKTKGSEEGIRELSKSGQELLNRLEGLKQPIVAAISGACLGGGLELALACDYRIAVDSSKTSIGLPEVMLGLMPGAGGTQRLPRLIGLEKALPMILQGTRLNATRALKMGIVDYCTHTDNLEELAIKAAKRLEGKKGRRVPKKAGGLMETVTSTALGRKLVFQQALKQVEAKTKGLYPAPRAIIETIAYGITHGMKKGLAREADEFARLSQTPQAKGLMSLYFAQNELKKNRFGKPKVEPKTIGVLGAGLMGSGIAAVSVQKKFNVRMRDVTDESLAKGEKYVWNVLDQRVKKRAMTSFDAKATQAHLVTQLDYKQFERCDLIIEAVFEDLDLKHRVLAEVEANGRADAIFASNTSALPIEKIAAKAKNPANVLGMHYFSPVDKMPLLEIVVTKKTSKEASAIAVDVGMRQGKTVIVVNDGPGFYTTRVLTALTDEAAMVALGGADLHAIDRAMQAWGFPVGPITLIDEVGIDVAAHIAHDLGAAFGTRLCSGKPELLAEFVANKCLGRKANKGFFIYESKARGLIGSLKKQWNRGPKKVNPFALQMLEKYGSDKDKTISAEDIQKRLGYRMINEAVYCLGEGILMSATDGDIGAVFGLGFPPFLGGPFRFLDSMGLGSFLEEMTKLEDQFGERFTPAPLLKEMVSGNKVFYP